MSVLLVTTSYYYQEKIESFSRCYIDSKDYPAVRQAADFFAVAGFVFDSNTIVQQAAQEVTEATLRESFSEEELPFVVGRYCALLEIDNGAPAIPVGTDFQCWKKDHMEAVDPYWDLIKEMGLQAEYKHINESFFAALFLESPAAEE